MGRTVPASTALLKEELGRWAKFRRAVRREDRAVLDWLFERARFHSDPASHLSSRTPFDALVLAMLIKSSSSSGPPVRWTSPTTQPAPLPPGRGRKVAMTAFLLDLYPVRGGLRLWFLDGEGRPFSLDVPSHTELFLSGPQGALRGAESVLHRTRLPTSLQRTARRELFSHGELPVLRVLIHDPSLHGQAVRLLSGIEGLALWNADIAPEVQFLLRTGLFPLAPCKVKGEGKDAPITPPTEWR